MSLYDEELTPANRERLEMLAEEAAEIVQAVTKILRHGPNSYHPDDPDKVSNLIHLINELGDFSAIVYGMMLNDDFDQIVDPLNDDRYRSFVWHSKLKYTHHQ